jgi:hypothetical protein
VKRVAFFQACEGLIKVVGRHCAVLLMDSHDLIVNRGMQPIQTRSFMHIREV